MTLWLYPYTKTGKPAQFNHNAVLTGLKYNRT